MPTNTSIGKAAANTNAPRNDTAFAIFMSPVYVTTIVNASFDVPVVAWHRQLLKLTMR